jgi:hypothetical protein
MHCISRRIEFFPKKENKESIKPFDDGLGKNMCMAAHPLGGLDSSNPCRWRGWRLHTTMVVGVCSMFVLCVAVFLVIVTHRM